MKPMMRWAVAAACLAAIAFLAHAGRASAAEKEARCRVMTIHASNKEGKTDEKLKDLAILKKPPFNTYKSFVLLSDRTYPMKLGAAVSLSLPVQAELSGKLVFKGMNEALKELSFKLQLIKSKSTVPEEINFVLHGMAPFLYVRPFLDGLLLLSFQCGLSDPKTGG